MRGAVIRRFVPRKHRRAVRVIALLASAKVLIVLGLIAALVLVLVGVAGQQKQEQVAGCGNPSPPGSAVPVTGSASGLTAEQQTNARIIAGVALSRGLGRPGVLVGIVAALTEATLVNVNHGDAMGPSSIGLFQQMPSWGPLSVRTDPAGAAGLFYDALVKLNPSWTTLSPQMAAQGVEQSEWSQGQNYARNLQQAEVITGALMAGQPTKPAAARRVSPPPTPSLGQCVQHDRGPAGGASVPAGKFISYTQWDPTSRWHSVPFWGGSIGSDGCGPTSVAEIVATWRDPKVTPIETAAYITSIGAMGQGDLLPKVFAHFLLTATPISSMDQAVAGLRRGGMVVVSGSGTSPLTSAGHFVVLRSIDPDGRIWLGDSNAPKGERTNSHSWAPSELMAAFDGTGIHSMNLVTNARPA